MDLIQQIKERLSISELVNLLGMEVNGSGFAYSIYKQEKTPSMKINFDRNFYWCFATHQGGDIINLYEDFYRLDTSRAIKELAGLAGIDASKTSNVKRERGEQKSFSEEVGDLNRKREQLFADLSEYEKSIYEDVFYKNEYRDESEAHRASVRAVCSQRLAVNREIFTEIYNYTHTYWCKEGYDYLLHERKISIETLTKFKIMVINNYYQLNNHLKKKYRTSDLLRAGLLSNEKKNLIFYKHRILIPYLHNENIVYLRGRYFDQDNNAKTDSNKYMGIKNDQLDLNRSKRFFNNDIIKRMTKGTKLFITEGEFDAMAMDSLGYKAIAIAGAGNIPEKKYFIPLLDFEIVVCKDNDEAGDGLLNNLANIFAEYDKDIKQKIFPTKDVNDFVVA